jgi:cysteinyl-tRNA synthetase
MVALIGKLLDKQIAYIADDGIYFSVEKHKGYGKLSGLSKGNLKKGARINEDQYDKESWSDFALWKFPSTRSARSGQVANEPSWEAPFGKGRPGWHIECSAMSMDKLGESFDIHCGGVDLLFPHHENEIAQSEAATGKKFVNYWLEGEHLLVDGQKMSKSLGNIYTLENVVDWVGDSVALRYLFLTAHYRSKLNFTRLSLESAGWGLVTLQVIVKNWKATLSAKGKILPNFINEFTSAINNDLDMPKAMAVMWETVKSKESKSDILETLLEMDKVLGLGLADIKKAELPTVAEELIKKREKLRNAGKFEESDRIRQELLGMGIEIEDTSQGSNWKKVKN